MADGKLLTFLAYVTYFSFVACTPEPGIWNVSFSAKKPYLFFTKSMYKDTTISVQIDCESDGEESPLIRVGWVLRYSPCADEYIGIESSNQADGIINQYYTNPSNQLYLDAFKYTKMEFIKFEDEHSCMEPFALTEHLDAKVQIVEATNLSKPVADEPGLDSSTKVVNISEAGNKGQTTAAVKTTGTSTTATTAPAGTTTKKPGARRKRDVSNVNPAPTAAPPAPTTEAQPPKETKPNKYELVKTWQDGNYIFILHIESLDGKAPICGSVKVMMMGKYGYISAVEWPLLIFYGVMGLVYIILGLAWLVMLGCNWRDLLRVQYWVGGVIVLGMLEKAVFYAEYQSISTSGQSVTKGAVVFAELISCLKRALARVLVIIVSLGFGIVKPRLGPTLQKVLFVGGLYFVVGSIEGCLRALKPKGDNSTDVMLAAVPLALVDASICWWIFTSLIQTTRTLRLRRNIVKLTLYRHFTNTLIFAVVASIIFMIWSIVQHKMKACLKDWRELWIDDAFWHLLFSIILMVIMILWRPSSNNQRYAFSPLLDAADDDDDEEEETVMNDAFQGMKMRPKGQANGSPKQKERNSIEDDLKWVEDNIPTSVTDKGLQSILDSDEEIMTAKYEMSKMQ